MFLKEEGRGKTELKKLTTTTKKKEAAPAATAAAFSLFSPIFAALLYPLPSSLPRRAGSNLNKPMYWPDFSLSMAYLLCFLLFHVGCDSFYARQTCSVCLLGSEGGYALVKA